VKNSWPMPQYQLHTAVHHDIANNTAVDVQLFIFKVCSHLSPAAITKARIVFNVSVCVSISGSGGMSCSPPYKCFDRCLYVCVFR